MKISRITLLALASFTSVTNAQSEVEIEKSYPSPANMLSSLIVSPYSFNSQHLNKMIFFRGGESMFSCDHSDNGKLVFADVEGGKVNTFSGYDLPSPKAAVGMDPDLYYTQVKDIMSKMKINNCIDVNLAPIIDFGYGNRSYFQNEKIYQKHIDAFVKANKDSGVKITYKHYPPNKFLELTDEESKSFNEAKKKWAKNPENLSMGYSEVEYGKYITGEFESESSEMLNHISKRFDSSDLIMLDNNLYVESGFTPYVASELPQKDNFLKLFPGLVITDDLYQLNLDNIDVVNVFKNSDLFIITSLEDTKKFHKLMIHAMAYDRDLIVQLKKKYDRVQERFN
ncbi:TPA: hypothetical protein RI821_002856 [Vibrio cholerae]|uniref:Uncharacterized protein n=1 Tax=Vibrio cholerae TaxID=666 RepID=A0A5Q6PJX5_VIBCL|nr:hypothetical protein [Vibrio cholerae]KAA1255163.1 hypothetical protein F0M16_08065 [Vibrio cholerae]HDV5624296.1 hypothetical protein [Vibrio cholerae]